MCDYLIVKSKRTHDIEYDNNKHDRRMNAIYSGISKLRPGNIKKYMVRITYEARQIHLCCNKYKEICSKLDTFPLDIAKLITSYVITRKVSKSIVDPIQTYSKEQLRGYCIKVPVLYVQVKGLN